MTFWALPLLGLVAIYCLVVWCMRPVKRLLRKGRLHGMVFSISGILSVPAEEFEAFIVAHGGVVVPAGAECTHLVRSAIGGSGDQDASPNAVVVDEEWVRLRVTPFVLPIHPFVSELIATDESEGYLSCARGDLEFAGQLFVQYEEDKEMKHLFRLTATQPPEDAGMITIEAIDDPAIVHEVSVDDVGCNGWYVVSMNVVNRWTRWQAKPITEGVWMGVAPPTLLADTNALVDELAASEGVDLHPGTNGIVRDLVHPSLYPLLLDPDQADTTKRNRWNRAYEKSRFQWLPAEVSINGQGAAKFTSPINNLDAAQYPALHAALEGVLTALVPGMEQVWEFAQHMRFTDEYYTWEDHIPEMVQGIRGSILQVIVKIADYVFPPGATFSGVWHFEGMAHENIVMTGLFYPNSDNRLGGGLEFKRQFTDQEGEELVMGVAQTRPPWLDSIIQDGFIPLGRTATETGKLMVFPNCHAHRVLEMANNTNETLHRRLVAFFIVDPNDRITSSKDAPPMPRKVSLETALADRLELMQERKQAKQDLNPRVIELCEH